MGRLIDGTWTNRDLGHDEKGRYVRRATQFRDVVDAFEPGRYRLVVSHACPWCHRVVIFRALRDLADAIELAEVEPLMGEHGWVFADGSKLYELYLRAKADYTGRVSVPVLWDEERNTVVNNESSDLIRMFDDGSYFPEDLRQDIAAMVDANYNTINNGVYRAGFAGNQAAHEEAVRELFSRLDAVEAILAEQRYLCGDRLTAADLCLFPTLYRFDPVYHIHFKCNVRALRDYPNLWAYTRDIYQTPGIAETCHLDHIKQHYYGSHESINPRKLVPLGPQIDYAQPHGRG